VNVARSDAPSSADAAPRPPAASTLARASIARRSSLGFVVSLLSRSSFAALTSEADATLSRCGKSAYRAPRTRYAWAYMGTQILPPGLWLNAPCCSQHLIHSIERQNVRARNKTCAWEREEGSGNRRPGSLRYTPVHARITVPRTVDPACCTRPFRYGFSPYRKPYLPWSRHGWRALVERSLTPVIRMNSSGRCDIFDEEDGERFLA
jgi:hypothetical protein